jgi:hypothetical protein
MDISCTNCGSENVQKLSLVHESGASTIDAKTVGVGVGTGGIGAVGAQTTGAQNTMIAARAAPPNRSETGYRNQLRVPLEPQAMRVQRLSRGG